jgi:uncharacterized flavoprotein (TIGR03862 family)
MSDVAIIGAGPAGLMAAEVLSSRGIQVTVYDAMPSVGRKFLLAGIGGMNITHSEALPEFLSRYEPCSPILTECVRRFDNRAVVAWIAALGLQTFVGSSGRVFPTDMKAAPLLRAWLARLKSAGVVFEMRHRWTGWDESGALCFSTPAGERRIQPVATVLALGGASWPRLGSDAAWCDWLTAHGVALADFESANCGFEVRWSAHIIEKFVGSAVKPVRLRVHAAAGDVLFDKQGELILTEHGIEGGVVYAASRLLREQLNARGTATVYLDLLPQHTLEQVHSDVAHPRGARSMSSHLASRLGLKGVRAALLHEVLSKDDWGDSSKVAQMIKALPITLHKARPIAEAISSAGGVAFSELNGGLMLDKIAGVFCAGEMLDWEAPTGGYLLTACLATGRVAGEAAANWLHQRQSQS